MLQQKLKKYIDFFYPPFRRIMPIHTFRYAACGGANTVLGFLIYLISYKYIFNEQEFDIGFFAFKPHIAALFISFIFTFIAGFLMNKYLVFTVSKLRGHIQLFRYFLSFSINLLINFIMLKMLVEVFKWNALVSQLFTTCLVISISYFTQKHFTFRSHPFPGR